MYIYILLTLYTPSFYNIKKKTYRHLSQMRWSEANREFSSQRYTVPRRRISSTAQPVPCRVSSGIDILTTEQNRSSAFCLQRLILPTTKQNSALPVVLQRLIGPSRRLSSVSALPVALLGLILATLTRSDSGFPRTMRAIIHCTS